VERKQAVSLGVRLAVSAAMLGVLVAQVPSFEVNELVPEWSAGTAVWLGVAAALTLAGIVLSAVRWQKVLDALEIRTKLPRLVRHNLAGQFVSNVLPTTIGGDVLRVSRLSRDTGESSGTFASVVLERLTGWLVLPVITIVGFAVNPGLRHLGSATSVALALSLGTLALLLGVLAAAASSRIGGRFATRADWRRFAGAVHLGSLEDVADDDLLAALDSRHPLTVGLALWQQTAAGGSGSQALFSTVITGSLLSIVPLVLAFLFLQRYWQSGLATGGDRRDGPT
jgi:uncharacterized membrane protein YbhN (UPF0104 family)